MKKIDKILQYADSQAVDIAKLERESGISNGYFANTKKRGADITDKILDKIRHKQPNIYAAVFSGTQQIPEPQPDTTIVNNTPMDQEQQDWKEAHHDLMQAHKQYAQSHEVLSNALSKMVDLLGELKEVKANLNGAAVKQQTFRAMSSANQRVILETMAQQQGLSKDALVKNARNLGLSLLALNEEMDNSSVPDNSGK